MDTFLEALTSSFTAACMAGDGVERPVALLWPDPDGQWRGAIEAFQAGISNLFILGTYDSAKRIGPVIWLKCVIERTLPDIVVPAGCIPIVYLPGVSRQILRAGGECPALLQPLIELEYRGAIWHQRNGRDWTVEAFLTSEDGLGLDMALDVRTREAMLRTLPLLANEPLTGLRGHRLEAEDFDRLAVGDPVRDLLMWMSGTSGSSPAWTAERRGSFRDICRREFQLDPDKDPPRTAGELLLAGEGRWSEVWRRFVEAPKLYPGVARVLRDAQPKDLFVEEGRQPSVNETEELRLARELDAVTKLAHGAACSKVLALEGEHGRRRSWVWTEIGQSAFAVALEPLGRLARAAQQPVGGVDLGGVIKAYVDDGWRADDAAMAALASAGSTLEVALIARVVRCLYEPWLDRTVRAFQEAFVRERGAPAKVGGISAEKDVCLLFVDGLRFDVGQRLLARLEARGMKARLRTRLTALPTVTATAKPAATPASTMLHGEAQADDFTPVFKESGQPAISSRLSDWMAKHGIEVIGPQEVRIPLNVEQGGWCETGRFDHLGHSLQADLARHLKDEVEAVVERIESLLNGGWLRVRVITDHGWLLLPGGLPKVELPHYLLASKWSRCATVKGESAIDTPEFGWHWNPDVRIATPPGIGCFVAGNEYSHGGISPQECVTPDLLVEQGTPTVRSRISSVSWRGMRCRVQVEGARAGLRVDLRLNWKQKDSSVAAASKEIDAQGAGSLAVKDDSHEGTAATVVLLDEAGQIIDHQATTIGEAS